jgi:4-alpha-glucanotransferase
VATPKEAPQRVRSAGILLHPTSLPGPYGIGDLGEEAYRWIDGLVGAGQTWWQILPLAPTGYGDSPYQAFSAFAGNVYLLSPDTLVQDGLLRHADVGGHHGSEDRVDYGSVILFKLGLLSRAWENFRGGAAAGLRQPFDEFCSRESSWLDDFALFMALKGAHGGASWQSWPRDQLLRRPEALERARRELDGLVGMQKFGQFLFSRQWSALKGYANGKGVRLVGDVPIFISGDSADVWANPQLFLLDEQRRPRFVAGVPPDYFSATGQLWGNPLYDWEAARRDGYAWWMARLRATLKHVDLIRLDHFRGFEAHWEVPAGSSTAINGKWMKGPGLDLFFQIREELGGLPLIAEDLGLITPEVEKLRDDLGLPGMRILQFAFGGAPEDRFLPHNYDRNSVVYTGTHDNDTTRGWYQAITEAERHFVRRYLGRDGSDIAWDLLRLAWSSVADWAVAPLQDVLDLGSEGRMNYPGKPAGNWGWRFTRAQFHADVLGRLEDLTRLYGRCPT